MLINTEETKDYLHKLRTGEIKQGLGLGLPDIDKYLVFKPRAFNVILGHANVGKTHLVLYLMLCYTMKHRLKWLIYSSENEPSSIQRRLIEFLEQQPINKISESTLNKHLEFINQYFQIISNEKIQTYKSLLEFATTLKSSFDMDGFFIDPYNSLTKDMKQLEGLGSHEYDYLACSEMRIFCEKHNVSIWLTTHANTGAARFKHPVGHEFAGHSIPAMASDAEGGVKFKNRATDFWTFHRYVQHSTEWMYTHIHVRKVKEVETGGMPTPIDEPVRLKSIVNNVGFTINDKPLLYKEINNPDNLPF